MEEVNGYTQINDVILSIPPENIKIEERLYNNVWQTLRTRSSAKIKSGFAQLDITMKVQFVDEVLFSDGPKNGLIQLKDLVSQFRVTPFCYVENQYLRDNILAGEKDKNMALALTQLELFTSSDQTNVVTGIFHFKWFNYFPYLKDFTFKRDIFVADEVRNPMDSDAWKLMYAAEQKKNRYETLKSINQQTTFTFDEFRGVAKAKYKQLKNDYELFLRYRENLASSESLTRDRANELGFRSNELLDEIFGRTTSMTQNVISSDQFVLLGEQIITGQNSPFNAFSSEWSIVEIKGKPVKLPTQLKTHTSTSREQETDKLNKIQDEDIVLLKRTHNLNLNESIGIIPTGIHISFENILATIPMSGYTYPTYQHIGSTDAVITLMYQVVSPAGQRKLSEMLNLYNYQNIKNRSVPEGHRNIKISNSLLQMCGLSNFIIEAKSIQTVLRQPGLSEGALVFLDDSLNERTQEKIINASSFGTSFDLRNKIAKALSDNLKIKEGFFSFDPEDGITFNSNNQNFNIQGGFMSTGAALQTAATSQRINIYNYTGPENLESFKKLCLDYAIYLTSVIRKLAPSLKKNTEATWDFVHNFFGLTNNDIVGIEKIQQDLYPVLRSWSGNTTRSLSTLKKVSRQEIFDKIIRQQQAANQPQEPVQTVRRVSRGNAPVLAQRPYTISDFVKENLSDWEKSITHFLDKIYYSGLLSLPPFDEVRKFLKENAMTSGGDNYNDFPLDIIPSLLNNKEKPEYKDALDRLNKVIEESDFLSKKLGVSTLINPDFYLFNHVKDSIAELIPPEIVKRAADGIIKSREAMHAAEKDWFKNVYDKHILEEEYAASLKENALSILTDSDLKDIYQDTAAGQSYLREIEANPENFTFMPNQLQGQTKNSLSESDKAIEVEAITVKNNSQNVSINTREKFALSFIGTPIVHNYDTEGVLLPEAVSPPVPNVRRNRNTLKELLAKNPPENIDNQNHKLRKDVAKKFVEMKNAAKTDGINLIVNSAFRDIEKQTSLYNRFQDLLTKFKRGEISVAPSPAAPPGRSMHEFGVAVDIQTNIPEDQSQNIWNWDTPEYKWLEANASRYGFLNVGKNYTSKEPWHWEYTSTVNDDILTFDGLAKHVNPNNESLLTKSLEQFKADLYQNGGYSMMKAYPTFKLYFIESDLGERKRYAFDDFFSYSAVKSINFIRTKKIAADLLIMELTNISGVLSNRKFQSAADPISSRNEAGDISREAFNRNNTNTINENSIASLMLQPGVQIQLRLGYDNNPENLEKPFNGVITDVEFSETDDLVTIVCQSYAVELVQTVHGDSKSFGGWFSGDGRTFKILEELISSPEVGHFGRWEGGEYGRNTQRSLLTKRWKFVPEPAEDNIFAPQGNSSLGLIDAILGTAKYTMYQTTLWDVMQEMTLRHPGYIASTVPYDGKMGPRMTFFFGLPDQLYFSRDSSYTEDNVIEALKEVVREGTGTTEESEAVARQGARDSTNVPTEEALNIVAKKDEKYREHYFDLWKKQYSLNRGFVKPFRSYHIATSALNIISNDIKASGHNVFNVATIEHGKKAAELDKSTGNLNFDGSETYTLKADAAIDDNEMREIFLQFPNCIGSEMAKNYCLSVLFNSLKEAYRGSLTLIGNPKIKPFDVLYIFDEYTQMYGPVEVEQVVHKFSQETGFVTEVTPSLMVHVNEYSTLSTNDAMGLMAEYGLKKINMESVIPGLKAVNAAANLPLWPLNALFLNSTEHTLSTGSSSSPLNLLGTFIFKKLITRTQLAHPFRFSPLILQSQPMIGGLPNRKTDGGFFQPLEKWVKDAGDYSGEYFDNLLEQFSPNNWANKSEGSITLLND